MMLMFVKSIYILNVVVKQEIVIRTQEKNTTYCRVTLHSQAKAGMVLSVSGWTRGVQVNCEIHWERVPYLSAL